MAVMRVLWLRKALTNLQEEAEYIALESPESARHVVAQVLEQINQLADYPESGRVGRIEGTRELVIIGAPYIVPYRMRGNCVEILRVFHSSRKWPTSL